MGTIKDEATNYDAGTKNISDLDVLDLNFEVKKATKQDENGNNYEYRYILVNNQEYRIPNIVLSDIKAILKNNPSINKVKVVRQGTTKKDTKYTTIPLL